jgi:hypothetical protein
MDAAQAVEVNSIMLATMAGAMVVLAGALYAAVYAIGKLADSVSLVRLSYLFYAFLVVSVLVLARTLNFSGIWNWVAAVMLAGYLIAPQGIWRLCVGTHLDQKLHGKGASGTRSDAADTTDSSPRSVS